MNRLNTSVGLSIALVLGTVPLPRAGADGNLALNPSCTAYPSSDESDSGWGGGWNHCEINDGRRAYDSWDHGLAFCGGRLNYCGQPCGWRQATINFGAIQTFDRVVIWHHGTIHTPLAPRIDYLDDHGNWIEIDDVDRTYGR